MPSFETACLAVRHRRSRLQRNHRERIVRSAIMWRLSEKDKVFRRLRRAIDRMTDVAKSCSKGFVGRSGRRELSRFRRKVNDMDTDHVAWQQTAQYRQHRSSRSLLGRRLLGTSCQGCHLFQHAIAREAGPR